MLAVFDDCRGRFGPLTDLRPVFDLRCGATTLRERIERAVGCGASLLWAPAPVQADAERSLDQELNRICGEGGQLLLVNGRWTALQGSDHVRRLGRPGEAEVLLQDDGQVVAARVGAGEARCVLEDHAPPRGAREVVVAERLLLERPWDLIVQLEATLRADIPLSDLPTIARLGRRSCEHNLTFVGDHPVRVAPDVKLHPMVVINTEKGPVAIDHGAIVGSFVVIAGPSYIGPGAIITPHTHIRANTAIGPRCIVGGEVSHSIFQGYANKAHAGYLGHSFVGEWVNLGAGTTVSNLKNTYGPVRVQLEMDAEEEDTGQTKLGPIIGDFVRTAIGTRLLSGACIGTGSMLATSGFAAKFVPALQFITDRGSSDHDLEKLLATARLMMSRRECKLSGAVEARLRKMGARQ